MSSEDEDDAKVDAAIDEAAQSGANAGDAVTVLDRRWRELALDCARRAPPLT